MTQQNGFTSPAAAYDSMQNLQPYENTERNETTTTTNEQNFICQNYL